MKKIIGIMLVVVALLAAFAVESMATCTQAISDQAKEEWLGGMFQPGDTYKIALYVSASSTLSKSTNAYTVTGEVSGTGYSAGGATLSGFVIGLYTDTATLDFSNATWSNSTITADCAMIYDSTAHHASCTANGVPWPCCTGSGAGATCDNATLEILTFPSTSSTAGTWTLTMPTPGASTSLIRIN